MSVDIRDTALYQEAEDFYTAVRRPGTGQISDAAEVQPCADRQHAVFVRTDALAAVVSPAPGEGEWYRGIDDGPSYDNPSCFSIATSPNARSRLASQPDRFS